jgi:hypothetical protein
MPLGQVFNNNQQFVEFLKFFFFSLKGIVNHLTKDDLSLTEITDL